MPRTNSFVTSAAGTHQLISNSFASSIKYALYDELEFLFLAHYVPSVAGRYIYLSIFSTCKIIAAAIGTITRYC